MNLTNFVSQSIEYHKSKDKSLYHFLQIYKKQLILDVISAFEISRPLIEENLSLFKNSPSFLSFLFSLNDVNINLNQINKNIIDYSETFNLNTKEIIAEITTNNCLRDKETIETMKKELEGLRLEHIKDLDRLKNRLDKNIICKDKEIIALESQVDRLNHTLKFQKEYIIDLESQVGKIEANNKDFVNISATNESILSEYKKLKINDDTKKLKIQTLNQEKDLLKYKNDNYEEDIRRLKKDLDWYTKNNTCYINEMEQSNLWLLMNWISKFNKQPEDFITNINSIIEKNYVFIKSAQLRDDFFFGFDNKLDYVTTYIENAYEITNQVKKKYENLIKKLKEKFNVSPTVDILDYFQSNQ